MQQVLKVLEAKEIEMQKLEDKISAIEASKGRNVQDELFVCESHLCSPEKQQILQTNCLSLLQTVPFNFELATFCFSHSKFFQLKKEDTTLGLRRQQIVNIFNDKFKKEVAKHHV